MKVLHICNDYLGSSVYKELYSRLDRNHIEQIVFCPTRKTNIKDNNLLIFNEPSSRFVFSMPIKKYHRIFFNLKIKYLFKELVRQVDFTAVDLIHATTFFSDGAIALKQKTCFGVPYIVNVRSTDVDIFLKYRPDLYPMAIKILENAKAVVFVSEVLKRKFEQYKVFKSVLSKFQNKFSVIVNGVNQECLENIESKKVIDRPSKIIYVGSFIKRKGLDKLIHAVAQLRKQDNPELRLTIVGGKGDKEEEYLEIINSHSEFVNYKGLIKEKSSLIKEYRNNHIFAMPSYNETFGLVYVEALSQGLPILMGRNEAIDGMLDNVGETVDPHSITSIKMGLKKLIDNYSQYYIDPSIVSTFNWDSIAQKYMALYEP